MKRKIVVNNTEYAMPRLDADTYMDYLELSDKIDEATGSRASKRYSREDIEAMVLFICKAYGDQFTPEELKNAETGLDAAGIILEFMLIDTSISDEINKRVEKLEKNFQSGK